MEQETVYISGATGFLGRSLVNAISQLNNKSGDVTYKIVAAVRDEKRAKGVLGGVDCDMQYDCRDNTMPIGYAGRIDHMICAAAETGKASIKENPVETYLLNNKGILHFLKYAKSHTVKSVVFLSSAVVYGRGDNTPCKEEHRRCTDSIYNAYTASKESGEFLCNAFFREYGIPTRIARLFQIYGDNDNVGRGTFLTDCIKACSTGETMHSVTDGKNVRNLIHVEDAAEAIIRIMLFGKSGETYNVGSAQNNLSFKEMADIVMDVYGRGHIVFDNKVCGAEDALVPDVSKLIQLGWKERKSDFRTMLGKSVGQTGEKVS